MEELPERRTPHSHPDNSPAAAGTSPEPTTSPSTFGTEGVEGPSPRLSQEAMPDVRSALQGAQLTAEATTAGSQAEEPAGGPPAEAEARETKPAGLRLADLQPGMVLEGTVTRIERYGAFVSLGLTDRRDGLIHISELAPYRVRRVEDVVQVGAKVRARVVSVDLGRGRISLSLNNVDEKLDEQAAIPHDEPALTSMALAFERAYSRNRERERAQAVRQSREDLGAKKRREQDALMQKLRATTR